MLIIFILVALIIYNVALTYLYDKVHENDMYINLLKEHNKRLSNSVDNLELQNSNLIRIIKILDERRK